MKIEPSPPSSIHRTHTAAHVWARVHRHIHMQGKNGSRVQNEACLETSAMANISHFKEMNDFRFLLFACFVVANISFSSQILY